MRKSRTVKLKWQHLSNYTGRPPVPCWSPDCDGQRFEILAAARAEARTHTVLACAECGEITRKEKVPDEHK